MPIGKEVNDYRANKRDLVSDYGLWHTTVKIQAEIWEKSLGTGIRKLQTKPKTLKIEDTSREETAISLSEELNLERCKRPLSTQCSMSEGRKHKSIQNQKKVNHRKKKIKAKNIAAFQVVKTMILLHN